MVILSKAYQTLLYLEDTVSEQKANKSKMSRDITLWYSMNFKLIHFKHLLSLWKAFSITNSMIFLLWSYQNFWLLYEEIKPMWNRCFVWVFIMFTYILVIKQKHQETVVNKQDGRAGLIQLCSDWSYTNRIGRGIVQLML